MISLAPLLRIDSQAKYGALSRGDGAIYLWFPHAEAGGVVTDAAGNPLDFSRGKYLDLYKSIVASNQKLMPAVLKESIDESFSSP
ncbi:3'(2'),5'-bisphosphate nucleotidase 1-like protein [Drosera capensis]